LRHQHLASFQVAEKLAGGNFPPEGLSCDLSCFFWCKLHRLTTSRSLGGFDMLSLKIPEAKEVIVGELAQRGEWIVANVETASSWPINSQKVTYRGETIWIMPIMKDHFPAVAMKRPPGKSREECERLLLRFLSNLAWVEGAGFLVDGVGGGSLPNPTGRNKETGFSICDEFDLSYFPEPASDKALLALALMREGRGLNHPGYSFLSFYRVLEVALGRGGSKQVAWINDQIASGLDHRAQSALDELRKRGVTDIGAHLYESGRCAMAHASQEPIIDPDDPSDARRLWSERPIMLTLAERAIEQELGVETSHTVYSKHFYELDGFKKIFGPELVDHLVRGVLPTGEPMVDIPDICVEIRGRPPYAPLSNLRINAIKQEGHICFMQFASQDDQIAFRFKLDFANERLNFDIFSDVGHKDFGTAESAEAIAECSRFFKEYFGNGQLRIVNADTGALISRKDAFMPMNMYLDDEGATADIARWKQAASDRRGRSARYAEEMARLSQPYDLKINVEG
jgi:hypothetical protein